MNSKLSVERQLNNIPDKHLRFEEEQIKRIQAEFGYDRENAARIYEYQQFKGKQILFNSAVGAVAAHRVGPFQTELASHYPLFRKPWMRVPIQAAAFGGAYYVASQLQHKFFLRFSKQFYKPEGRIGLTPNHYLNNHDLISKFRFFEDGVAQADAKNDVERYLDIYTSGPLTKSEMLNRFAEGKPVDANFSKNFKIKRMGKDKDDIFWSLGKIHGLENIALCDLEELKATKGDPIKIQALINKAHDAPRPATPVSFEKALEEAEKSLEAYKAAIENFGGKGKELGPSDRKKLLALPFYLIKRRELPEPKKGQKEWNLFREIYGKDWNTFAGVKFDQEEKITEFNYEKFIHKQILKNMDTTSDEFKNYIKMLNLTSRTQYEQHCDNQETFKDLMPYLSNLDEEETDIFLHLIRNKNRNLDTFKQTSNDLIDAACSDEFAKKLAKISEEENFALKNRYKHQKDTMQYADKKRMPISKDKVRDLLRNEHIFRDKINTEIQTYTNFQDNTQYENGVLTYVNEAAWGDLRDLLKDIGVNKQTIRFANVQDLIKKKDSKINASDINYDNLKNARFTQVDMTDYEYDFPSLNEIGGQLPIHSFSLLEPLMPEMWPQSNALVEVNMMEKFPKGATSRTHRELQEARDAEVEEEEDEDEEEDDEDEDEEGEGEEGEEGEEGDGDEEDEEEEEEDEEEMPDEIIGHAPTVEDRYFLHNEKLRGKFNEVELDSFMKLLNVKPLEQWEDETTHHYKVGTHTYEDDSQHLDPYFHLIAEVERKHMERQQTMDFRRGTEVKFVLDPKKRPSFGGV